MGLFPLGAARMGSGQDGDELCLHANSTDLSHLPPLRLQVVAVVVLSWYSPEWHQDLGLIRKRQLFLQGKNAGSIIMR